MSLAELVTTKATGSFGTFAVKEGNVTKGTKLVLTFFNGTTALIPMDARSTFTTVEEHTAFDYTLMQLALKSIAIQYVESIPAFMNPTARFVEFLNGTLTPQSVGLKLTPEELAVPTAYVSAKAKFDKLFTPPTPPREMAPKNTKTPLTVVTDKNNKKTHVDNSSYKLGYTTAKRAWAKMGPIWAKTPYSIGSGNLGFVSMIRPGRSYSDDYGYTASELVIGCQTISRYQIEQLALAEGWPM